uniref:Uncharacterized protein n=1 Tax=Opuntia streptacantha TaxID=393608 RepID=A0A7C8ZCQ3_OPUST
MRISPYWGESGLTPRAPPHSPRCIHHVVPTGWLEPMLLVTLVHHLGPRATSVAMDHDFPQAPGPASEPPGGSERATTGVSSEWYWSSHSEGPPPSPPSAKLLRVSTAAVWAVTGGEHQ